MTPQDILNSGQVYSANRIGMMLARYGFAHKRTTGSHKMYTHTEYSDEIVGLVQGTTDIVYQKKAAEACLRVIARNEQKQIVTPQQAIIPELPEHYVYVRMGDALYIRNRQYPMIGRQYDVTLNIKDEISNMDTDVTELKSTLDILSQQAEFMVTHHDDGSVHFKHPVYPLEEIIFPFGSTPQSLYPEQTLMYLAEYCNSYDRYMLSPGFEQYLQRNKAAIRYTQTRTSQGLRQYTISNTPAAIKNHGATPPFEITLTAKGRMDVVSVTRHIQYILQSNINTLKTWENSGMRYTDLGNDQTRCTHDFMEIDFVIDNPHALRAQIKDTLDILLSATQDKSEQDEWAEKLEHLAIKLEKIGSDFRDIGNQITSHYTRWNDEFSDCMKKLNAHGYTRHNSITPDGYFSVLTLNHTDPAYREVTLYAIPQGNTTRKTFLIIPYKKMINTLRELITQCDARKNPAPKTTTHALFNSTKPTRVLSFKTPASSIPPAVSQGVNLSHDNILATEQIKGKARRLRLETPDAKTAKMILASMPKMKF